MAVVLLIKISDGTIIDVPMFGSTVVIGRSSKADIKIDDKLISSRHCSIELKSGNQLIFRDLASTNGSFLNNSRIQEVRMKIGDRVQIGDNFIYIDESKLNVKEKDHFSGKRANFQEQIEMTGISQKNISEILKKESAGKPTGGIPKILPKKKAAPVNQEEQEPKDNNRLFGLFKKLLGKK